MAILQPSALPSAIPHVK